MSGFESPNFTQVPNSFFDMMADMNDTELRVTLVAIRQIMGFHKTKPEPISISQFMEKAGVSKQGALDGVEAAVKRGTIKKDGTGKRNVTKFTLVVSEKKEVANEADQSNELTSDDATSQTSRPVTSQTSRHTKESSKEKELLKENIIAMPQFAHVEEKANTTGKTPKPRKENRIFNGIAFTAFDIDTRKPDYQRLLDDDGLGGRIGKIERRLKKAYPDISPEDIFAFFKHYKAKFPNADMPRDPDKYLEHFAQFKNQAPKPVIAYSNNTSTLAQAELSEQDRAAALASFQAGRLQKASGE